MDVELIQKELKNQIIDESTVNNICLMTPKNFGMIAEKALKLKYDNDERKISFKTYRVIAKQDKKVENALDFVKAFNKTFISIDGILKESFVTNIQQIKTNGFDELYYSLFFKEGIIIFKINYNDIINDKNIKFNFTQPSGNTIKGQFQITKKSLPYHIDTYFHDIMKWDEFFKLLKEISV